MCGVDVRFPALYDLPADTPQLYPRQPSAWEGMVGGSTSMPFSTILRVHRVIHFFQGMPKQRGCFDSLAFA